MDITEKYILMCEKAKEIQESHDFLKAGGILGIHINGEGDWHFGRTIAYNAMENIWLPTQDQLQEMLFEPIMRTFVYWLDKFSDYANNQERHESMIGGCYSMEQLWLAFVMHEKYGKVWLEGEWKAI